MLKTKNDIQEFVPILSIIRVTYISCTIKSGTTTLFWSDLWNENIKCLQYQHLYASALYKNDSVKAMCSRTMEDYFLLPLSDQAYSEYL